MLSLAFLWHMHQPWYLDPTTQRLALPWVRLHGTKDYLDMALSLKEHPQIHAVVNFSPCLLEQLGMYEKGILDEHQRLCLKPAADLTPDDTIRLLELSFLGQPARMVHPYPRYSELLGKAQRRQSLVVQERRDLQVWSNLAWMSPRWRREEPLSNLVAKGSHFAEEEKQQLLQIQLDLLKGIIPTYRELAQGGQLELSTSPWAHPILPLLLNTETASQTNPGCPLPSPAFHSSEDVTWHLRTAVTEHTHRFGQAPRGLWPSEGSVSEAVLPAVSEAGFRWIATDEELLWKSWAFSPKGLPAGSLAGTVPISRSSLYQPYQLRIGEKELGVVFRDHVLSDLIGFVYNRWSEEAAVTDFVERLKAIDEAAASGPQPPLVLVALDGENPWESYAENGELFLKALYQVLSRTPFIRCSTISEHLQEYPPRATLNRLAPGSWIRGEFSTWIGHEPQNRAWEELRKARQLIGPEQSRSIAIAEGSDWFWWLGPEHQSSQDPVFDRLFRAHLKAAYQAAGQAPPPSLDGPLKAVASVPVIAPMGPVNPTLDGEVTSYFEWLHAGELDLGLTQSSPTMARAKPFFSRLLWGCDAAFLYLRFDPTRSLKELTLRLTIQEQRFEVSLSMDRGTVTGQWRLVGQEIAQPLLQVSAGKVVELALPLIPMGFVVGQRMLKMVISIEQEVLVIERYPEDGQLVLPLSVEAIETWSA